MRQNIKGNISVEGPAGIKVKADSMLGFYGITLVAILAGMYLYLKYGHKHIKKITRRKK